MFWNVPSITEGLKRGQTPGWRSGLGLEEGKRGGPGPGRGQAAPTFPQLTSTCPASETHPPMPWSVVT